MEHWGKTRPSAAHPGERIGLPLREHCADVAFVFRALASLAPFRSKLRAAAGSCITEAGLDRLAVLAFLHDLGKANRGFQAKLAGDPAATAGHVRELGPLLFEEDLTRRLESILDDVADWFDPAEDCERFLLATWSHHGDPLSVTLLSEWTPAYRQAAKRWWREDAEGHDPLDAVADLMAAARDCFPGAFVSDPPLISTPALQHRFAGLVMLADWLGSHEAFFPVERDPGFDSAASAQQALRAVGIDSAVFGPAFRARPSGFPDLFGFLPRPLQGAVDTMDPDHAQDRLLIIEAETGSGKTEAALARYFSLLAAGAVDSLYFALPTRVAAREIYGRIWSYVERNFPDPEARPQTVLAVPGYARLDNMPPQSILPSPPAADDDALRMRAWAAERPKRFLAAPIAVGTIDQALLSVLATRHAHLRSVCLDRSLLVVDEVHASDAYMRSLLERLLEHHLGLGGQALLLSATLGSHARSRLVSAAGGDAAMASFDEACAAAYPALTNLDGRHTALARSSDHSKGVTFSLTPTLRHPEELLGQVATALGSGARVLAVFNTVARAVAFARAAEGHPDINREHLFCCRGVICPHHGRFASADREVLDEAVSSRLGLSSPDGPLLLVGTQTLEQSLDIDADLLICDLCPADVLLQRVGRLHRHRRSRPKGYDGARCLVLSYTQDDLPTLVRPQGEAAPWLLAAGLGSVYEDLRTVELTRRLLTRMKEARLPDHNRLLVESATHPEHLARVTEELRVMEGEGWSRHGQMVEGRTMAREIAAHYAAAPYAQAFGEVALREPGQESRARTRLGLDDLVVTLDQGVLSPFAQPLREFVVPGHLAPSQGTEEAGHVLDSAGGVTRFCWGSAHYTYSRFGLEKEDARQQPAD